MSMKQQQLLGIVLVVAGLVLILSIFGAFRGDPPRPTEQRIFTYREGHKQQEAQLQRLLRDGWVIVDTSSDSVVEERVSGGVKIGNYEFDESRSSYIVTTITVVLERR